MLTSYQLFNVFGTLKVERSQIVALASAFDKSGGAVEKTVRIELTDPIQEIPEGEICVITFAAYLEAGKRPQIAAQQLSARLGGPTLLTNKQVRAAFRRLVDQF
jgi:hypothetical protein